jgi:hypothetical protein
MGKFQAYTLFEPAVTLIVYEGVRGFSEQQVVDRCKTILSTYGAMDFIRTICKRVDAQERTPDSGSVRSGSGRAPESDSAVGGSSFSDSRLGQTVAEGTGKRSPSNNTTDSAIVD